MSTSASELMSSLRAQFENETEAVRQSPSLSSVESLTLHWVGKKSEISRLSESLKTLPKEERPIVGKALNEFRSHVEKTLTELQTLGKQAAIESNLQGLHLDVTLPPPCDGLTPGGLHPVTLVRKKLLKTLHRMGFAAFEGPEIESDFYNFEALNIPQHHPARDMQDTFFVSNADSEPSLVLRTHTSNVQIHALLQERVYPIRLVSLGRTYRVDDDATHTPMFHQIECLAVDRGLHMGHLRATIEEFLREIFGKKILTRLRPSYFPFVEPGAELDMSCVFCQTSPHGCRVCKETGWLELGGCGMVHPRVLEATGHNPKEVSGFALGFGLDRMAMLLFGLKDLRVLFEGSEFFHKQFPIWI